MKKRLGQMDYIDMEVVFKCLHGFPIVGDMGVTGVFERRPVGQVMVGADTTWLACLAIRSREDLVAKIIAQPVDDVFREIYRITTDREEGEVAKGWAIGHPSGRGFTEDEMTERFGHLLRNAARRFGVVQRNLTTLEDKIRQIDDFTSIL